MLKNVEVLNKQLTLELLDKLKYFILNWPWYLKLDISTTLHDAVKTKLFLQCTLVLINVNKQHLKLWPWVQADATCSLDDEFFSFPVRSISTTNDVYGSSISTSAYRVAAS